MYKMYLILAEGYKKAKVDFLTITTTTTTSEIWVSMKDVGSGMGVKNICDLVLKKNIWYLWNKTSYKKTS